MDCDHQCEVSQYELDNAISDVERDADTNLDNLQYVLERKIEQLARDVRFLEARDRNRDYMWRTG